MHFFGLVQLMIVNGTCPGKSWKKGLLSPGKPWNFVFASPGKKHSMVCTNPVFKCFCRWLRLAYSGRAIVWRLSVSPMTVKNSMRGKTGDISVWHG